MMQATILDVSRGGICPKHTGSGPARGTVRIGFSGNGKFGGRIAHNADGLLRRAFQQDENSWTSIDRLPARQLIAGKIFLRTNDRGHPKYVPAPPNTPGVKASWFVSSEKTCVIRYRIKAAA